MVGLIEWQNINVFFNLSLIRSWLSLNFWEFAGFCFPCQYILNVRQYVKCSLFLPDEFSASLSSVLFHIDWVESLPSYPFFSWSYLNMFNCMSVWHFNFFSTCQENLTWHLHDCVFSKKNFVNFLCQHVIHIVHLCIEELESHNPAH